MTVQVKKPAEMYYAFKNTFNQFFKYLLAHCIGYFALPYSAVRSCSTRIVKVNDNWETATATRGSAIAEEPRDALRQLKYCGRLWTELLTTSSANPEEPCEHNVSWNHVKCCTNVRQIACENVCNRWMTFNVIQGHCCCHHLIGHILFSITLPL